MINVQYLQYIFESNIVNFVLIFQILNEDNRRIKIYITQGYQVFIFSFTVKKISMIL